MELRSKKLENIRKVAFGLMIALGLLSSPLSELGKWVGLPWRITSGTLALISISSLAVVTYISFKLERKDTLLMIKISAMAITGFILWTWLVVSFIPRMMR